MSSTNKTANLQLHSWVRTDPVVCEDFNDNFNKLDGAIANLRATSGNCLIYTGTYTGTGGKTVTLVFPKAPLYLAIQKDTENTSCYTGFVVNGAYFFGHSSNSSGYYNKIYINGTTVSLQESGTGSNVSVNVNEKLYRYMALVPAA